MNVQGQAQAASRAGGSSFYLAMRILKREQREAMFEIYSFCRQVDDIADSDAPHPQRVTGLSEWRRNIDALYSGRNAPGLDGLAKTIVRFDLRKADFLAVIDGVEMDARADICAPSMEELDLYCDRVASAVGRLSVRVFGMNDTEGQSLAHHLGRALQLTNILRDIDEDAEVGRLYLPREALQLADIDTRDIQSVLSNPRLGIACAFIVDRARAHFAKADEIMANCPRQVVRAPKIMGAVYRQMLEYMVSRGWLRPRNRVHVNKSHLLWIALRHAFV
ncbi:MAG TPA: presqualene diphosphate synthase HpnD [Pseudolabrys sp.]|nr:presqualene diphosphate synthase HpnD [Pseudolabrys sp.]